MTSGTPTVETTNCRKLWMDLELCRSEAHGECSSDHRGDHEADGHKASTHSHAHKNVHLNPEVPSRRWLLSHSTEGKLVPRRGYLSSTPLPSNLSLPRSIPFLQNTMFHLAESRRKVTQETQEGPIALLHRLFPRTYFFQDYLPQPCWR